VLKSVLATSAVIAAGNASPAIAAAATRADPATAARSAEGDVVGKVSVGYQGWFAAPGDKSPIDNWWHYGDPAKIPSEDNNGLSSWPDVREFTKTYATGYADLGNGTAAELFSSHDAQTVDTHFLWMQQNNIDTAALQRFYDETTFRNDVAVTVKTAAEAHDRKFYIMYDVSGWADFATDVPTDWVDVMVGQLKLTDSSAYARQNGKPVVCVWGLGLFDRPDTPAQGLAAIKALQEAGCYVIIGVDKNWLTMITSPNAERGDFTDTFTAADMITPWMVGVIGTIGDTDWAYGALTVPDLAYCDAHGIDYQPCVLPGSLQESMRLHGDFVWRQFYNMARAGVASTYISMFDEFNEGNQIAKTAETAADVPAGSGFRALDEDGTACSADYYLRLTNDGMKMLTGKIALTSVRPTEPVVGGGGGGSTVRAVTLTSAVNGKLVTAEDSGDKPLIANRTVKGPWEMFDLISLGQGAVALKAQINGKYVCADSGGDEPLITNRTEIGSWETFQMITNADGTVSFKAAANGKYVSAEAAGDEPLIADRTASDRGNRSR
jgi:hypothetical protein